MRLQLLNFNSYIEKHKIGEVVTYRIPSKTYDPDGLWSEVTFGPLGSKSRMERFGYIDLKTKCIHPEVLDLLTTVSEQTSRLIHEKEKYSIQDKVYVPDPLGQTGIIYLIDTLDQVDLRLFCHSNKTAEAEYIEKSKKFVLIDKYLVLPAGMRDFDIYSNSRQMDEINELYTKLIVYRNQLSGIEEFDTIVRRKIQNQLTVISDHIKKTKMTGKRGLFRGTMLRKSLDYTSRLVLTNDPKVRLGEIGLPWHTLVAIYEPFVIHQLFNNPKFSELLTQLSELTENPKFDDHAFSKFVKMIINAPDKTPNNIRFGLTDVLNEFLDDQMVMIKRDPVQSRNSWFSAKPVITEGRVAYVNSVDLGPIGGDSDGDTVAVVPIFTEEAKKEIRDKMNPATTKSKWIDPSTNNGVIYIPSLDAISAIYRATKV